MIDLYALTSPNVQKIYIMLEETKLPYKEHFVDVWKGEQYAPDFIKINPNSKIPAIVDHDGPGGKPYTVFESGAILLYLAEKTGQFLPKDPVKRYDVLQWLMIQLTGIGPMFGQRVHFRRFAPPGNDYAIIRYGTEVQRLYDVMEERLADSALYLRRRVYDRRHRHLPVAAQQHAARHRHLQPAERETLHRHNRGAAGGASGAGQSRPDQIQPRHRERRSEGPFLQSRQICQGVTLSFLPRENGGGGPREAWWKGRGTQRNSFDDSETTTQTPPPPRNGAVPLPRYRGGG